MTQRESDRELEKGMRLRVKIQGLGSLGEGLARVDNSEIFIPKTAPGDEVDAEILEKKKGRYLAKLLKIESPGPTRIEAECKHFEICGGCDFQHLPMSEQSAWKLRMAKHWIRRSPLAPFVKNLEMDQIHAPNPFGYRHRVRIQVKNGKPHFFKPHSHQTFALEECPILVDGFFESICSQVASLPDTKDVNISALNSYEIDGHQLKFSDACFSQGNLQVNELLWKRIEDDVIDLQQKKAALDLFCGIGNFSVPLTDYFESVTGVESEGISLEYARKNSAEVEWIAGDCSETLEKLLREKRFFDFVLLDPPRMGALKTVESLKRMSPPAITYVSCNLESLIVDLTQLIKKGGYQIKRFTIADLFPQTHHIESIVSLVPK